jgi:hypothetical protein
MAERPWRSRRTELALDVSHHVVYGVGAALVFVALD